MSQNVYVLVNERYKLEINEGCKMQAPICSPYNFLLALWAAISVVSFAPASLAQSMTGPSTPSITILDGKTFTGEIIPIGQRSGRAEDFVFADGKFHSKVCLNWGFKPGPYWVRLDRGRVHFLATLTSPENGVMTYRGVVVGSTIEASVDWVKPRWYWTMERQFRFEGKDTSPAKPGS